MSVLPILFNNNMVQALLEGRKTVTRRVIKGAAAGWEFRGLNRDPAVFRVRADGEACPKTVKGLYATFEADPGVWFPIFRAPYEVGDVLYVRETWAKLYYVDPDGYTHYDQPMYYYAADGTPDIILRNGNGFEEDDQRIRWRPSIHMPKEAARIFLKVKDVRVERLQEITEEQARAEGVGDPYDYQPPEWYEAHKELAHSAEIAAYAGLWNRLYAKPMPVRENGKVVRYESYPWENIRETKTYRGKPWLVIGNPWLWAIDFERTERPEGAAVTKKRFGG